MNQRAWKKYRRAKAEYKTRVTISGNKGVLIVGEVPARQSVEAQLGRRLKESGRTAHTRYEWVFCERIAA